MSLVDRAAYGARHTVSVAVCTYTDARWHDLRRAIESLHDQTLAPLKCSWWSTKPPCLTEGPLARRELRWVPYSISFMGYNYFGMVDALRRC